MNDKIKEIFSGGFKSLKNSTGYLIVFAHAAIYTLTAFITIEQTGKSVWQIVVDGILAFFIGIFINRAFEFQGIMNGDGVDVVKITVGRHIEMVDAVSPYIDRLEAWCDKKNHEALRTQRTRILAEKGMKYSDYFTDEGMTRDFKVNEEALKSIYTRQIEKTRIKCYYKALSLKLTPLTASVLTSEGGKAGDPYYLGRSKPEYTKDTSKEDVITKTVFALIFGYFGVSLIENPSVADIIWKGLQVVLFVMMGSIRKYKAYGYVTEEFCGRITKKNMHLHNFMCDIGKETEIPSNEIKEKMICQEQPQKTGKAD
jgi:hypothetical protein